MRVVEAGKGQNPFHRINAKREKKIPNQKYTQKKIALKAIHNYTQL